MPKNESSLDNISNDDFAGPGTHIQISNPEQQASWTSEKTKSNKLDSNKFQTHDYRLAQADAFRNAKQKLQESLRLIQENFASPNIECHSGRSDCRTCGAKNQKIIDAYKDYFLSSCANSWHADILGYEAVMQERFRDIKIPTKQDLRDLYLIFSTKLRDYIMLVIGDLKLNSDIDLSNVTSNNTAKDIPLKILVQKAYDALYSIFPNSDAKQLIVQLQKTKTAGERAPHYIQYYCSMAVDDTPQQRNFKIKYARMFENHLNHDEVLTAMQKEAQELNSQRVNALYTELGELQLAQSAHLKKKIRKAENVQQVRDRKSKQKSIHCSLACCGVELDRTKANTECALCEWLERKGSGKGRFFYCSTEHAAEDFERHDLHEHKCSAGDRCVYYPQAGPPHETSACGICLFCIQNKKNLAYFCSKECYNHNLEWHVNQNHEFSHKSDDANVLEHFILSQEMQIIS